MRKVIVEMAVLLVALVSVPVFGDYLTNGSFEDPAVASGTYTGVGYSSEAGGWLPTDNAVIKDNTSRWQISATGAAPFPVAAIDTGNTYTAFSSWVGSGNYIDLHRNLDTLAIGTDYTVSGYVAGSPQGYDNCMWRVQIGSTILGEGSLTGSWTHFSYIYTANSTDGTTPTIYLMYANSGGGQTGVMYDAVSVVPEPVTVCLLSFGGLWAIVRRRHT